MLYIVTYLPRGQMPQQRRAALGRDGVSDVFAEMCADRFLAGDAVRAVRKLGEIPERGGTAILPDESVFIVNPGSMQALRDWAYDTLGFGTSVSDDEVVAGYNAYQQRKEQNGGA